MVHSAEKMEVATNSQELLSEALKDLGESVGLLRIQLSKRIQSDTDRLRHHAEVIAELRLRLEEERALRHEAASNLAKTADALERLIKGKGG